MADMNPQAEVSAPVSTTPTSEVPDSPLLAEVHKTVEAPQAVPTQESAPIADEEVKEDKQEVKSDVDLSTGDKAIDTAIALLQKQVPFSQDDVNRLLGKAVEYGNIDLIDEAFAKEKFGDSAQFAIDTAKAYMEKVVYAQQEAVNAVYKSVGGEKEWSRLLNEFKRNAPAALVKATKVLSESGDIIGASELVKQFSKTSNKLSSVDSPAISGQSSGSFSLSPEEYADAMRDLLTRARKDNASLESGKYAKELKQLQARRAAYN